jgi:hypothetical protein
MTKYMVPLCTIAMSIPMLIAGFKENILLLKCTSLIMLFLGLSVFAIMQTIEDNNKKGNP